MTLLRTLFSLIIVSSFCSNAWSQQTMRGIKISTLSLDQDHIEIFYLNNGQPAKLTASTKNLGQETSYTGRQGLIFYLSEEALKKGTPEAGRVILPKNSNHILLTFQKTSEEAVKETAIQEPGETSPPPLKINAHPIDTTNFKSGSYRFFNFSEQEVSLELDDENASIKAGEQTILSSPSWTMKTSGVQFVASIVKPDGTFKKAASSSWGHRPDRRYFIIIEESGKSYQPLTFKRFFDTP